MNPDEIDLINEVKKKLILHWSYRELDEIPECIRKFCHHVTEMYLKQNNLKTLPPWICEFSDVTNIYLYANNIEHLPHQLGCMEKLRVLDLAANQLKTIPTCLGNLKNLQVLILNQNSISVIPSSLNQLENLENLGLSRNDIKSLPEWLVLLPKLQELNLDNNSLVELPNSLTLSSSLKTLSVCSNKLSHLPLNGFYSNPDIYFDFNEGLNYLSLPVFLQLNSKIEQHHLPEFGNHLAHGTKEERKNNYLNISVKIVPEDSTIENKNFILELPKQILHIHSRNEIITPTLWELSLRKLYITCFEHTMDLCMDPPNVTVKYDDHLISKEIRNILNSKYYSPLSPIKNGPISLCANRYCNQPIFTEAWTIIGSNKNSINIPIMVTLCSHRCSSLFFASTNFKYDHIVFKMIVKK